MASADGKKYCWRCGDAQYVMGEFFSRCAPLAAIALTTDTSVLNRNRQRLRVRIAFRKSGGWAGPPGDIFIGISTSGLSPNVLQRARCGEEGRPRDDRPHWKKSGDLMSLNSNVCVRVPADTVPLIRQLNITSRL